MGKFESFLLKCKRVWYALRKPSKKEFWQVAKVSAIGILILGAFGFLMGLIMNLIV